MNSGAETKIDYNLFKNPNYIPEWKEPKPVYNSKIEKLLNIQPLDTENMQFIWDLDELYDLSGSETEDSSISEHNEEDDNTDEYFIFATSSD